MTQEEILEYNKRCAEFLGWELFQAKSAIHNVYGGFEDWHEPDDVYIEEPTEEFKKHLILSEPQEVGLDWDFKLFKSYHWASTLKFHSDLNWIMEVVEAIAKIPNKHKDGMYKYLVYLDLNPITGITIEGMYSRNFDDKDDFQKITFYEEDFKTNVVQAINQFLIWYKEQTL